MQTGISSPHISFRVESSTYRSVPVHVSGVRLRGLNYLDIDYFLTQILVKREHSLQSKQLTHPNLDIPISIIEHREVVSPGLDGEPVAELGDVEAVLLEADLGGLLHRVLVVVVLDHEARFDFDQLVVLVHDQFVLAAVHAALFAD